jgi:hypothetical protein
LVQIRNGFFPLWLRHFFLHSAFPAYRQAGAIRIYCALCPMRYALCWKAYPHLPLL